MAAGEGGKLSGGGSGGAFFFFVVVAIFVTGPRQTFSIQNKPIGPEALTLMDRQTCVSSAHGQTDSQCLVIGS